MIAKNPQEDWLRVFNAIADSNYDHQLINKKLEDEFTKSEWTDFTNDV